MLQTVVDAVLTPDLASSIVEDVLEAAVSLRSSSTQAAVSLGSSSTRLLCGSTYSGAVASCNASPPCAPPLVSNGALKSSACCLGASVFSNTPPASQSEALHLSGVAPVLGKAFVFGTVSRSSEAFLSGAVMFAAPVSGAAVTYAAPVSGTAVMSAAPVSGKASVFGAALLSGAASISDVAPLSGAASINGKTSFCAASNCVTPMSGAAPLSGPVSISGATLYRAAPRTGVDSMYGTASDVLSQKSSKIVNPSLKKLRFQLQNSRYFHSLAVSLSKTQPQIVTQ